MAPIAIPRTLREHLLGRGKHKVRTCRPGKDLIARAEAAGIPLHALARAELLKAGTARLLAVYPADAELDLDKLNKVFKRRFERCPEDEVRQWFADCDPDALPPFGLVYGVKTIVDSGLEKRKEVFYAPGVQEGFVRSSGEDFTELLYDAWRGRCIASSAAERAARRDTYRKRIERLGDLPPMPAIAEDIIRMRNNPYTHASELAAVIGQDPSLSAQLIRYARSSFFSYQGEVKTVEHAIVRVLGMDFVLDFAFGLALGRPFRNPRAGPLGLDAFWRHSVHAAALAQVLCNTIPYGSRPSPGVSYLAGLLHNFGFLLLGHLFPKALRQLNRGLEEEPDHPIEELERKLIGVTHGELGMWLMEAWDMPREIVQAVREHHDPHFRSDFSDYANLLCVANRLLARVGIGDEHETSLPVPLLGHLGLSAVKAEEALGQVLAEREALDYIARRAA